MPLTPYLRPQSTITQILRATAAPQASRINPVVIGPQYDLVLDDGRDMIEYAFDASGATLKYQKLIAGVPVDLDLALNTPQHATAKLIGRDLRAKVAANISTEMTSLDAQPAVLFFEHATQNLADMRGESATLVDALDGRSIEIGDYVLATASRSVGGNVTAWRRVTALLPRTTPSSPNAVIDVPTEVNAEAYDSADDAQAATIVAVGTYTGTVNNRYIIEVTTGATFASGNAVFRVWDAEGREPVTTITGALAGQHNIGSSGVKLEFTNGDPAVTYVTGAKFYVDVVAEAAVPQQYDKIQLDSAICARANVTSVTIDVHKSFSGELTDANIATGVAVTASATDVVYGASLGLGAAATGKDSQFSAFADGVGTLVLSYKALKLPLATESPIEITTSAGLAQLGEVHVENWLARGAYEAFSGNQSRKVFALRTAGDSVEAFTAALNKIRSSDVYYALAPMTDRLDVMQAVADHCTEMSNKYNRNFRRCYVGTDSPGEVVAWGQLAGGGYRTAQLDGQVVTVTEAHRAVSNFTTGASVGDFIKFGTEEDRFPILAVISAYEVLVDCSPTKSIPADGFQLIHAASSANTVKFLQSRAEALANRRCVNVWCDYPTYDGADGPELVPLKFVAAEIAGIRCALLPQQGLTMTEITSVTSAPTMFTTFLPEQLDAIAASGNMVVTQESLNGEVFIRHQLTTDVSNGALAYQDNVGVVVDVFSYSEKDAFRNYIGRRNVTEATISALNTDLLNLAIAATKVEARQAEFGPMVIRFFDEDGKEGAVTVRTDGQVADRLLTYVKLRVALPLDGLDNYVDVESSTEL